MMTIKQSIITLTIIGAVSVTSISETKALDENKVVRLCEANAANFLRVIGMGAVNQCVSGKCIIKDATNSKYMYNFYCLDIKCTMSSGKVENSSCSGGIYPDERIDFEN